MQFLLAPGIKTCYIELFKFQISQERMSAVYHNHQPENRACRRRLKDRRRQPTPLFSRYTFVGRRRGLRRREERYQGHYVDRFNGWFLGLILAIFILSLLDGFLTVFHLRNGAVELNPIMRYYLELSPAYFLLVKTFTTGVGLLILLLHQNFLRIRRIIYAIIAGYTVLVSYQLMLLALIS